MSIFHQIMVVFFIGVVRLKVKGRMGGLKRLKKQVEEVSINICAGSNHFADQSMFIVLITLPLGCGKSGHTHLLWILPDFGH